MERKDTVRNGQLRTIPISRRGVTPSTQTSARYNSLETMKDGRSFRFILDGLQTFGISLDIAAARVAASPDAFRTCGMKAFLRSNMIPTKRRNLAGKMTAKNFSAAKLKPLEANQPRTASNVIMFIVP